MDTVIKLPNPELQQQVTGSRFVFPAGNRDPAAAPRAWSRTGCRMVSLVRLAGCVLLSAGLRVGLKILLEGFHLYRDPVVIEAFAAAVAQSSSIDHAIAPDQR